VNKSILNLVRNLAAALILAGTASSLQAATWTLHADAAPVERKATLWGLPRDDPTIAIGALVLASLIFAAVAWVAARVGDKC